ncbi:Hypothetical protein PSEBR_m1666 [Pseudomonas brassicacearum subsp. brassicacearum NFM421]|uniref:Uncharacterized protein n=1 Tax=Pseudomonas brassicacearum (strain NFM421) TaxID=994484 RepID=F2K637_PSEBN|nr:Hypothetical protein PSEBR_m1666 [Pseudomonas brassicacearum subsp. brassicacearum NFM421]
MGGSLTRVNPWSTALNVPQSSRASLAPTDWHFPSGGMHILWEQGLPAIASEQAIHAWT